MFTGTQPSHCKPDVLDHSRLLQSLGRINYKILTGERFYIEVGGIVYKTLYGAYWRSVFTGKEHYTLKCEQISGWRDRQGSAVADQIDVPIEYSNDDWTAKGHSLSLMLIDC